MSNKLSEQINIGKELERLLIEVDINNIEELKAVGAENAFIRIQTVDPTACLSKLSALEGVVLGIRWHNLPPQRKDELKAFFKMVKK